MPFDKIADGSQQVGNHRTIDKGHQNSLHQIIRRHDLVESVHGEKYQDADNNRTCTRQTFIEIFFQWSVIFHMLPAFLSVIPVIYFIYSSKPFMTFGIT